MRKLFDTRSFDECLRPLEQFAELVDPPREAFAEEGVESDPENQVASDWVQVDRLPPMIVKVGDHPVNGRIAAVDDHRDPAVETGAGERSLHGPAAAVVIGAIGHDHRSFPDDETNTDDVELVLPAERFDATSPAAPWSDASASERPTALPKSLRPPSKLRACRACRASRRVTA